MLCTLCMFEVCNVVLPCILCDESVHGIISDGDAIRGHAMHAMRFEHLYCRYLAYSVMRVYMASSVMVMPSDGTPVSF